MSTALRSFDCSPTKPAAPALVPADLVRDLIAEKRTLEGQIESLQRDLKSARARNATLMYALRRCLQAPAIVGQSVVDGILTLTYSSGKIMQRRPTCEESADSIEYSFRWVETQAPETPAAVVAVVFDESLVYEGMAVIS